MKFLSWLENFCEFNNVSTISLGRIKEDKRVALDKEHIVDQYCTIYNTCRGFLWGNSWSVVTMSFIRSKYNVLWSWKSLRQDYEEKTRLKLIQWVTMHMGQSIMFTYRNSKRVCPLCYDIVHQWTRKCQVLTISNKPPNVRHVDRELFFLSEFIRFSLRFAFLGWHNI